MERLMARNGVALAQNCRFSMFRKECVVCPYELVVVLRGDRTRKYGGMLGGGHDSHISGAGQVRAGSGVKYAMAHLDVFGYGVLSSLRRLRNSANCGSYFFSVSHSVWPFSFCEFPSLLAPNY